jgi:hypothetical protein
MKNSNGEFYVILVEDTKKYGIICASIISRVRWWCEYNQKNKIKDRYHNGQWWSGFMSARSFAEQTGISQRTIEKNLTKLLDNKVLIKDIFNKKGYDRTGWYRVNPNTPIAYNLYPERVDDIPLEGSSKYADSVVPNTLTEETIPVNHSIKQDVNHSVNTTVNTTVNPMLETIDINIKLLKDNLIINSNIPTEIKDIALQLVEGYITSKQIEKLEQNKHYFNKFGAMKPFLNKIGITL